jgi:hypothetical protein
MKNHTLMVTIICCIFLISGGCSSSSSSDSGSGETTTPSLVVTIYDQEQAYEGRTFLTDGYNNRLVEVDMNGNILWQYSIPDEYIQGDVVGFEAEVLPSGRILMAISNSGIYEIDREGTLYWSYADRKVSHDADRLQDGSTIYVFGNNDAVDDLHVKVVTQEGVISWSWNAADDYLALYPYDEYAIQGWTHINGVQRLTDGTTMVSLRNFFLTTILDENGDIVREYDWSAYGNDTDPHDPVMYEAEGTLVVCLQNDSPYIAVEIDAETEGLIWSYSDSNLRTTRDCNKLPNGNYLIVTVDQGGTENDVSMDDDTSIIIEVTPQGEVVWRLELQGAPVGQSPGWFFKAQRLPL